MNRSDLRVRELWVGNLPESITEKKLYSNFFIYGEIDRIEIVPHKN
jgi:RNA recognition motif-containing protein